MKPIKNILRRPSTSPTRNMLNAFFLREDQDGFARQQGYADAEQMIYYEDLARLNEAIEADKQQKTEVPPMTDNEVEQLVEREEGAATVDGTVEYLAPPPSEILVFRQEVQDILVRAEQMRLAELASIHEAARQYELARAEDDGACPLTLWYDTSAELAGVY